MLTQKQDYCKIFARAKNEYADIEKIKINIEQE